MELRRDLYDKMVSLDASEPTSEEHDQQAITKLRYMQVGIWSLWESLSDSVTCPKKVI